MSRRDGRPPAVEVVLEVGGRRTFASALDWPGWARSGRGPDEAVAALTAYAARYAVVADEAGIRFPFDGGRAVDVAGAESVEGSATTDFGAPGIVGDQDRRPWSTAEAERQCALLRAAWTRFDAVAAGAPRQLRKGPRGGGRDTEAVVQHVLGAETAYARKMGIRQREPAADDRDAVEALRSAIIDRLIVGQDGRPLGPNGWPPRYAVRRAAWHVLDHLWEIEDRSDLR